MITFLRLFWLEQFSKRACVQSAPSNSLRFQLFRQKVSRKR